MRYLALACDYDGTIALDGRVDEATAAALQRVRASGRRLLLVTGRQLEDLALVYPDLATFDRIVAENGALVYDPATRETRKLAASPPTGFVAELSRRGVAPLSVGKVIVATWRPNETAVLEAIRDLGLELNVIFNKHAVMVLPAGINKATGLIAALKELELSPHNVVGVGDAENDQAFLRACECRVAVSNALESLKERMDLVTERDHGAGVTELIDRILADDLAGLEPVLSRHDVTLGQTAGGEELRVHAYGEAILIAGPSGVGKSTVTAAIVERLRAAEYQFCVVDPEGDYQDLSGAVCLRVTDPDRISEQAVNVLHAAAENLVLNLVDIKLENRPAVFRSLLPQLQELRTRTGRPHWIIIDEAHHLLPFDWQAAEDLLPARLGTVLMITVHPERLAPAALTLTRNLIALGDDIGSIVAHFAVARRDVARAVPPSPSLPGRWACLFGPGEEPRWFRIPEGTEERQRHRRKYAAGELGEDKSFYFRGPESRLNLRTQNLTMFSQIADGVDDETWVHHLRRHDYSRWFREAIKDDALAEAAAAIEMDTALSPAESRARIRRAIEERYTSPA